MSTVFFFFFLFLLPVAGEAAAAFLRFLPAATSGSRNANQPTSTHIGDGLELTDVRVAAAVRCAPPANAPTPEERDTCSPWLARELELLPRLRVVVVLGGFGWTALWPVLAAAGSAVPRPRPLCGHGVEVALTGPRGPLALLGSYHVSQQNTFTGKLTEPMLDAVLSRATELAAG